jgi:site-specific DNA recombinase
MGAMIFAILASFAAEERRVITGRTVAGKKEKAARGGFAGGAAPLGYRRDLKGGLLIDETESSIVRQVALMRENGLSLQAIARALNQVGMVSKRGGRFHASTIRYMLDNPKYRGLNEYYFRHDGENHCLTASSHDAILPKRRPRYGNRTGVRSAGWILRQRLAIRSARAHRPFDSSSAERYLSG